MKRLLHRSQILLTILFSFFVLASVSPVAQANSQQTIIPLNQYIDVYSFYANYNYCAKRSHKASVKVDKPEYNGRNQNHVDIYTMKRLDNQGSITMHVMQNKLYFCFISAYDLSSLTDMYFAACASMQSDSKGYAPVRLNDNCEVGLAQAVGNQGQLGKWQSGLTGQDYYVREVVNYSGSVPVYTVIIHSLQ